MSHAARHHTVHPSTHRRTSQEHFGVLCVCVCVFFLIIFTIYLIHSSCEKLVEQRSAQSRDRIPPLGAVEPIRKGLPPSADFIAAQNDVGEGVGVLVQEWVEESHLGFAGVQSGLDGCECGWV